MPRVGLLLTLPLLVVPETAEMLAGVVREHGGAGVIQAWLWLSFLISEIDMRKRFVWTEVVRQPVPLPGPGEVQVRVAFAGVNFIDIYFREAGTM